MSMDKDGDSPMSPHESEADEEGKIHYNEADTVENSGEVKYPPSAYSIVLFSSLLDVSFYCLFGCLLYIIYSMKSAICELFMLCI